MSEKSSAVSLWIKIFTLLVNISLLLFSIVCQVKYCSEGVCTEPSEKSDVQGKHIPKNLRTQLVQINKKD